MVLFDKNETALFLAEGDFWLAVANAQMTDDLDGKLADLIDRADELDDPNDLFGTMPDDTQPCIGTSPRRPRKPQN